MLNPRPSAWEGAEMRPSASDQESRARWQAVRAAVASGMLLSPRGLASIVFSVIFMGQNVAGTETLAATVVCMGTFSILGHGLTAYSFVTVYPARAKRDPILRT